MDLLVWRMALVGKNSRCLLRTLQGNDKQTAWKDCRVLGVQSRRTLGFTWLILRMKTLYSGRLLCHNHWKGTS